MKIPSPGDYIGKCNGRIGTEEAASGAFAVVVPYKITQGDSAGFTSIHRVWVISKEGKIIENAVDNLKLAFDWDGANPFDLTRNDYDQEFALAECIHEEYSDKTTGEKKTSFKVGWLNPLNRGMKMPEPADEKSILAKYGAKFRALATPAKKSPAAPVTTTTKKTPPATPKFTQAEADAVRDAAWNDFCAANPGTYEEQSAGWSKAIGEMFPGQEQSKLSPADWGKLKASFDNVPM